MCILTLQRLARLVVRAWDRGLIVAGSAGHGDRDGRTIDAAAEALMEELRRACPPEAPAPVVRMMPDQTPYTASELRRLGELVEDAAAGDPGEQDEPPIVRVGNGEYASDWPPPGCSE